MKEELVNIVNEISEECWKCIDKYSLAGFSRISGELATAGGEGNGVYSLTLTPNESGSLVLGEDYRRLLLQAIGEYQRFYKEIISQLPELQKMKVLKEPAKAEQYPLKGFEFLKNLTFQDNEAKAACEKYYDLAKTIEEINFPALTKLTHSEFAKKMNDIKSLLEGKSVPLVKDAKVKGDMENAPDSIKSLLEGKSVPLVKDAKVKGDMENAPDSIKTEEGKNTEQQEEAPKDIPAEIKQDSVKSVKGFNAMIENPANWGAFKNNISALNDELKQKSPELAKAASQFAKQMGGANRLAYLWKTLQGLGIKDAILESAEIDFDITSAELLMLIEAEEAAQNPQPEEKKPEQAEPEKTDEPKEEPKQEGDETAAAKLLAAAKDLLKIDDEARFVAAYKEWRGKISQLAQKANKKDLAELKYADSDDPMLKLAKLNKVLKEAAEFEPIGAAFLKRLHERLG